METEILSQLIKIDTLIVVIGIINIVYFVTISIYLIQIKSKIDKL